MSGAIESRGLLVGCSIVTVAFSGLEISCQKSGVRWGVVSWWIMWYWRIEACLADMEREITMKMWLFIEVVVLKMLVC